METTKKCTTCAGSGRINQRREKAAIDYHRSAKNQEDEYFTAYDTCPTCKGKGFLELKWI